MPQQTLPSGQDWETQNAGRGTGGMRMSLPTTGRELERARAMGLVTTEKRYGNNDMNPCIGMKFNTVLGAKMMKDEDVVVVVKEWRNDVGTLRTVIVEVFRRFGNPSHNLFSTTRFLTHFFRSSSLSL